MLFGGAKLVEFSLKDICRDLANELQMALSEKNRVKLSIDIELPDTLKGDCSNMVSTVRWLSTWVGSRLVNGLILIDLVKRSHVNRDVVIAVTITGTNITPNPRLMEQASEFAAVLPADIRVKPEESRVSFEFHSSFETTVSTPRSQLVFLNKCILIAEDSEINALVFAGFMEEWGCDIKVVQNGRDAIEELSRKDYDLILMDIHMPIMTGNEAIREIRENNKSIPIIALTASTLESDIKESMDNGANDYLLKPVASKTLFALLKKYLLPGGYTYSLFL